MPRLGPHRLTPKYLLRAMFVVNNTRTNFTPGLDLMVLMILMVTLILTDIAASHVQKQREVRAGPDIDGDQGSARW